MSISDLTLDEIKKYLHDLAEKVKQLTAASPKQAVPQFSKCLQVLEQLEQEDDGRLITIFDSLKDNPHLKEFPSILVNATEAMEVIENLKSPPVAETPAKTQEISETDCSKPDCDEKPDMISVAAANIAVATLEIAVAGAEAAKDLIPETALGFTNPAWIVAAAIANGLNIAAKVAAEVAAVLELEAEKNADCEEEGYQTMLRGICSTTNAIYDTVQEINGKVDILLILVNEIKTIVIQISERQIEQLLASCTLIVSLYLPVNYGGQLENVQKLVGTRIEQSKAAGLDVCNAQAYFNQGVTAALNGEYKKAYQWYMDAYKQLLCC